MKDASRARRSQGESGLTTCFAKHVRHWVVEIFSLDLDPQIDQRLPKVTRDFGDASIGWCSPRHVRGSWLSGCPKHSVVKGRLL